MARSYPATLTGVLTYSGCGELAALEAVSVAKVTAEEAKNPLTKYVDIPAITDQFQAIRLEVSGEQGDREWQ